eukprot:2056598-Rhodomonas_salina.2
MSTGWYDAGNTDRDSTTSTDWPSPPVQTGIVPPRTDGHGTTSTDWYRAISTEWYGARRGIRTACTRLTCSLRPPPSPR